MRDLLQVIGEPARRRPLGLGVVTGLTRGAAMPAAMIAKLAHQDIDARRRNAGRGYGCKRYAFLRQHVRAASSAADLIERAIRGFYDARHTSKRDTKLIYSDQDALRTAHDDLARAESTDD